MLEQTPQPEEKARAKDRRSAKTGVRAGGAAVGRAPTSTVAGEPADSGPDPMTYALQQVRVNVVLLRLVDFATYQ